MSASHTPGARPRLEPLHSRSDAGVEIELKLQVPSAARDELESRLERFGAGRALKVDSTYFDTADRRLAGAHAALRIRRVAGPGRARWVQTFKCGDEAVALSRRGEWESELPAARLQLRLLADTPLAAILGQVQPRLAPVFRTRFTRIVRDIRFADARIEAALDEGWISAGRRKIPILELELELHEGPARALLALALALIGPPRGALALLPGLDSKAARGYRLAAGAADLPVRAVSGDFSDLLRPQMTAAQAARRIVEYGVNAMLANVAGAALGKDPEFVHQARVALRRTRSGLRLMTGASAGDDQVANTLRWISDRFAAVRDWDALVLQRLPSLRKGARPEHAGEWDRIVERAQRRQTAAQARLAASLSTARFARCAVHLLLWSRTSAGSAGMRLGDLAQTLLGRERASLLAGGRRLQSRSVRQRHRLRIRAKRLRYAIEILGGLLDAGPPRKSLRQLTRLQDALGEAHDLEIASAILPSLTRRHRIVEDAHRSADRTKERALRSAAKILAKMKP
jgi:triphosphatase